eukprot:gene5537-6716_t
MGWFTRKTKEVEKVSLHVAAAWGNVKELKKRLETEPIDQENEDGITALHMAAAAGHLQCLQCLLDAGANVAAVDPAGCTPLHFAAGVGKQSCVEVLVHYHAPLHAINAVAPLSGVFPMAVWLRSFVMLGVKYGETALDVAWRAGKEAAAMWLEASGAKSGAELEMGEEDENEQLEATIDELDRILSKGLGEGRLIDELKAFRSQRLKEGIHVSDEVFAERLRKVEMEIAGHEMVGHPDGDDYLYGGTRGAAEPEGDPAHAGDAEASSGEIQQDVFVRLASTASAPKYNEMARQKAEQQKQRKSREQGLSLDGTSEEPPLSEGEQLSEEQGRAEEARRIEAELQASAEAAAEAERQRQHQQMEAERLEAERLEAARVEAVRKEAERLEAERLEAELLKAARVEAVRKEAERLEAERLEAERLEAARVEAVRKEAEQLEAERVEAERLEVERKVVERLEAERLEAERVKAERMEAERRQQIREEKQRAMEDQRQAAIEAAQMEELKQAQRLIPAAQRRVEQVAAINDHLEQSYEDEEFEMIESDDDLPMPNHRRPVPSASSPMQIVGGGKDREASRLDEGWAVDDRDDGVSDDEEFGEIVVSRPAELRMRPAKPLDHSPEEREWDMDPEESMRPSQSRRGKRSDGAEGKTLGASVASEDATSGSAQGKRSKDWGREASGSSGPEGASQSGRAFDEPGAAAAADIAENEAAQRAERRRERKRRELAAAAEVQAQAQPQGVYGGAGPANGAAFNADWTGHAPSSSLESAGGTSDASRPRRTEGGQDGDAGQGEAASAVEREAARKAERRREKKRREAAAAAEAQAQAQAQAQPSGRQDVSEEKRGADGGSEEREAKLQRRREREERKAMKLKDEAEEKKRREEEREARLREEARLEMEALAEESRREAEQRHHAAEELAAAQAAAQEAAQVRPTQVLRQEDLTPAQSLLLRKGLAPAPGLLAPHQGSVAMPPGPSPPPVEIKPPMANPLAPYTGGLKQPQPSTVPLPQSLGAAAGLGLGLWRGASELRLVSA